MSVNIAKIRTILSSILFVLTFSFSAMAAEQVFFYHTDPAGMPLAMTNSSGAVENMNNEAATLLVLLSKVSYILSSDPDVSGSSFKFFHGVYNVYAFKEGYNFFENISAGVSAHLFMWGG